MSTAPGGCTLPTTGSSHLPAHFASTRTTGLHRRAARQEALGDAALVEHLDGARVETARTRALTRLRGAAFDDDHVDLPQREFGREREASRTTTHDHHVVPGHAGAYHVALNARRGLTERVHAGRIGFRGNQILDTCSATSTAREQQRHDGEHPAGR